MIKQVDITEKLLADNLFLVKIKANALCYGDYDFCKTFYQLDDSEKITAYINLLSDGATVFCFDNADKDEIKDFLVFYGIKNVFSNVYFQNEKQVVVLKYSNTHIAKKHFEKTFSPDYKSVYDLLKSEFLLTDYNSFVSDLSFRLSHGFARLIETENGVAFTMWETENSAVISTIAVDKGHRKAGIGTKLLSSITADLLCDKQDIYVYCEDTLKEFYIKNGFMPIGFLFTGELTLK